MYINTTTMAYPVSERQIRQEFPTTLFPVPFQAPEPYAVVFPAPKPEHDPVLEYVTETTPELTSKGHYEQRWAIHQRYETQEEIDAALATTEAAVQEQRSQALNVERDRRIAAGAEFTVTGYATPIPLTGTDRDQTIITALLVKAQGYKAAGVTDPVLMIRDRDNVVHNLTPDQMIELTSAGMNWVEAMMKVSWDMKDKVAPFEAGIPEDFATNESYWP